MALYYGIVFGILTFEVNDKQMNWIYSLTPKFCVHLDNPIFLILGKFYIYIYIYTI
jgi:hypothetical protein